jgi:hypothetical protein
MTWLEQSVKHVRGDRMRDYDHPARNFDRIARMWSVILDTEVTPTQFALCMIVMKVARHVKTPKDDNLIDIGGYLEALDMALNEEPPVELFEVSYGGTDAD